LVIRSFQYVHASSFVYAQRYLGENDLAIFIKLLGNLLFDTHLNEALPHIEHYTKAKETSTGGDFNKQFILFDEDITLAIIKDPVAMILAPMTSAGIPDFYAMCLALTAYEFGDKEAYTPIHEAMLKKYNPKNA